MNVFILNSGRCGSTTFIRACQHITNYTATHESLSSQLGEQRMAYPRQHIEADNRLSWFLGRLDKQYADNAIYIHLQRDKEATAESFIKRKEYGIMQAYLQGILQHENNSGVNVHAVALDYIESVTENIHHFLKDKNNKMNFQLENAQNDFKLFWELIAAQGDFQAAIKEWDVFYNASEPLT